jgi:cbb3-type cytochrome oxidase maturation protein
MGRPPASADVKIEYLGQRPGRTGGRGSLFWLYASGVAVAVLLAVLALLAFAYARQSERVDDLQAQSESILDDHEAIGQQFAQQSTRFTEEARKLEEAVQSAYSRGFRAGRETANLPPSLRPLGGHAAAGLLVPRRIPGGNGSDPRVQRNLNGYILRWPRLAVFASRLEPLSNWTRQALGQRRRLRVGRHRVERLLGPGGVVYAWRESGVTYAVIATPTNEPAARTLIRSMR